MPPSCCADIYNTSNCISFVGECYIYEYIHYINYAISVIMCLYICSDNCISVLLKRMSETVCILKRSPRINSNVLSFKRPDMILFVFYYSLIYVTTGDDM